MGDDPASACVQPPPGKRCPRGCKRNKSSGLCEPAVKAVVPTSKHEERDVPCADPGPGKRCPKGCRRSKKDGKCYPSEKKKPPAGKKSRFAVKIGAEQAATESTYPFLYPSLDNPQFAADISARKEFYDTRYEGGRKDVVAEAEKLCNAEFELAPHQVFVRNFLSLETPYNGMLLYHGLGSGKTCSAIGVAEEMRDFLKQTGVRRGRSKILIVAAPNVQDNFKMQLFDPSRLKETAPGSGTWSIRSCTGAKYLKEINPLATAKLSRDKIVRDVQNTIRSSYKFLGYEKFANQIVDMLDGIDADTPAGRRKKRALESWAENRLIIIDEVHNISGSNTKDKKVVSHAIGRLVRAAPRMRLLLLSATPMYHDPKEIIWLLNLLRTNDGRGRIRIKDVFESDGRLREPIAGGRLVGAGLLAARASGYVSFVRGENPYTFPYRIWPSMFAPEHTLEKAPQPKVQLNGAPIRAHLEHLDVFVVPVAGYQAEAYEYIVSRSDTTSLQYTALQVPIQALDMTYPALTSLKDSDLQPQDLVAAKGLARVMNFEYDDRNKQYIPGTFSYAQAFPRIFSQSEIGNYSAKISTIVASVLQAKGVILVHTEYIGGGVVPLLLALEEAGLSRAGKGRSLFTEPPVTPSGTHYAVITGDQSLSPDNPGEIRLVTNQRNVDGSQVKVVIISQAGAEGLDLKFIRQVHVMEPWYNLSRIEQIIGRAVRTCSHRDLPFTERNVQIMLYASTIAGSETESADMYVYRQAEARAMRIGAAARVLKEASVDCLLNIEQMGFTVEQMDQVVPQTLGSGQTIEYAVGDRPFTAACDYMSTCTYKCRPVATLEEALAGKEPVLDTYGESGLVLNTERVMQKIRDVFSDRYFASKSKLVSFVNQTKLYPLSQIDAALSAMINDRSERLIDRYGRPGRLVNVGIYYYFEPLELDGTRLSNRERQVPVPYKRAGVLLSVPPPTERHSTVRATSAVEAGRVLDDLLEDIRGAIPFAEGTESSPQRDLDRAIISLLTSGVESAAVKAAVTGYFADRLDATQLVIMLNELKGLPADEDEAVALVREWVDSQRMKTEGMSALRAFSLDTGAQAARLVVLRESDWGEARPEDLADFKTVVDAYKTSMTPADEVFGSPIGFLFPFKRTTVVFKVKDMYQAGKTGARCDQGGPTQAKKAMSELMSRHGLVGPAKAGKGLLCAFQELALRVFTQQGLEGRKWFFSAADAVVLGLPKLSF